MFTKKPNAMHRVMIVYVLTSDKMEDEQPKKNRPGAVLSSKRKHLQPILIYSVVGSGRIFRPDLAVIA